MWTIKKAHLHWLLISEDGLDVIKLMTKGSAVRICELIGWDYRVDTSHYQLRDSRPFKYGVKK